MNSSHICLTCRRTIGRIQLRKVVQWHPKSSFISLSGSPPTTTDGKSTEDISSLTSLDDGKKGRYISVGTIPERRKRTPRQSYNHGDQLEILFEESLKQPPSEAKEITALSSAEVYIHADKLRKMLADETCATGASWRFFVDHFGPDAWKKGLISQRANPSYLHQLKMTLIKKLCKGKRQDPLSLDLPTVTEVSKVYSQVGVLECREWVDMMLVLLESLIKLDQSSPEQLIHGNQIVSDLLGSWNVVSRKGGKSQNYPPEGSSYDWSNIPVYDANLAAQAYRRSGNQGLFGFLAPIFPIRSQYNVAVVAISTFALLTRTSFADKAIVQEALPMISSLGAAITTRGFDVEKTEITAAETIPNLVVDFLDAAGSQVKEAAFRIQSASATNGSEPTSLSESRSLMSFTSALDSRSQASKTRTDLSSMGKRLFDAMHGRDVAQVNKLWSDAAHFPVAKDLPRKDNDSVSGLFTKQRGTLTADLCNYFVMIYMALHQPSRAIEVWNHMIKSGLPPNLKTWDSMLTGCRTCRDPKALEEVWMRMLHLGVQPDVVCWTTRISGLIECNKVPKAMHALDEMGRIWLAANKAKSDILPKKGTQTPVTLETTSIKPVKPTIETVNAAVSALLRKQLPEAAHRVLIWSAKFNITPNVITYNTLLMPLIRDGHRSDAMALLKQMQQEGIEADVGTFTTILDDILGHPNELTPTEQRGITDNLLLEMESAGIKANLHTYGKMIYQLLQNSSGDMTVVNVVLEHMAQQGLQPTAYIYTMILSHYFSQDPPDLDAVRNLIERVKDEVGSVDHIFWDRVIEGYARAGDTASAMRILGKHEAQGSRASWVTKQALLTALIQNEEWSIARSFVGNVKIDFGGPSPEMKNQEGQQRFWRLAADLQLL